jgi:hypothetical protein
MAVYLVEDTDKNKHLIEARSKQGAVNHVSKQEYTATTLTTGELVKYIREGLEVQTANADDTEEVQIEGDDE